MEYWSGRGSFVGFAMGRFGFQPVLSSSNVSRCHVAVADAPHALDGGILFWFHSARCRPAASDGQCWAKTENNGKH